MNAVGRKRALQMIEEWRAKARGENDAFNKYVSVFIAYNIFYSLYAVTRNPQTDLSSADRAKAISTLDLVTDKRQLFQRLRSDLNFEGKGKDKLSRLLTAITFAGYVSVYLAIWRRVVPAELKLILSFTQ